MDNQQLWTQFFEAEPDRVVFFRLGRLKLWLARAEREWAVAFEEGSETDLHTINRVPMDVIPTDLDWVRYGFREAPNAFKVVPRTPDRPIVLRPPDLIHLPPGESMPVCAVFPAWVAVQFGQENGFETVPIQTQVLSDTWFGSLEEGHLCYAIEHPVGDFESGVNARPNDIVCPVKIENQTKEDLVFERLCLRTRYLSLFAGRNHLWSTPVHIRYTDADPPARFEYPVQPPSHEQGLRRIYQAEQPEEKVFHRFVFGRTFGADFQAQARK